MSEQIKPEKLTVDQIREQMRQHRREFDSDVEQLVENAQSLTDWRQYVVAKPMVAFALCSVVGYLLVPGSKKQYEKIDPKQLAKLVRSRELVVAPADQVKATRGIVSGLLGIVASLALKAASGAVMEKIGSMARESENGKAR